MEHEVERGLGRQTRTQDGPDLPPALEMALEPARPLPDQDAQLGHSLLADVGTRAVVIRPTRQAESHAEFEVFGETVSPRRLAQIGERRQSCELTVATEADTPELLPGALEDLGERHELEVL